MLRLQEAGCALLTVHGRTRYQNKDTVGTCNFEAIAAVKAALRIPVVANGGVAVYSDLNRCLEVTGADGVMSSEAALENPAMFCNNRDADGQYIDQNRLAHEYLDLAERHLSMEGRGSVPKCVKAHLFKFLHCGLQDNVDLRDRVGTSQTFEEYRCIVHELQARGWVQPMLGREGDNLYRPERSWYYRHRGLQSLVPDPVEVAKVCRNTGTPAIECAALDEVGQDEQEDMCWSTVIFD